MLGRRRPGADVDDIAAAIVERFLADANSISARFPEPAAYARVAVRRGAIAFDRHERAQRGEGVRLATGADGLLAPRRTVLSGDELFDAVVGIEPADDALADRIDAAALLAQCLTGISVDDQRLLFLVDGAGYTVSEVAHVFGQRRETVSRRLNHARRTAQQNRVLLTSDRALDPAV